MPVKSSVWLSVVCLMSVGSAPWAAGEEPERLKGFHASPRSIYRSLQTGKLCDQDDPTCAYRIDLSGPTKPGSSQLRDVTVANTLTVIPEGDPRFTCNACAGKRHAEPRVVQLRIDEACASGEVMTRIATDHAEKTISLDCAPIQLLVAE